MKICVIGAGVIGLCTAYALRRRGHDVMVADAAPGPGSGASAGNGAQLSYCYVAPLADASVWRHLPHYLLDRQSPLTFRPRLDAAQWRWLARFLLACNGAASARSTAALLRLAFLSRDCLAALQHELRLAFDFRTAGKLVMLSSEAALTAARRQVVLQSGMGCAQQVLPTERCIEIEPALAAARSRWAGGVYTASEQVGDCARFCEQLAAYLAHQDGVAFHYNTAIAGARLQAGRIDVLTTAQGSALEADAYVLANGVGSALLARQWGWRLPVYPLKGYSVTFDTSGIDSLPSVSVTDLSRKIVYARIGQRLRVAGRVEIVGHDLTLEPQRWGALAGEAQQLFPALEAQRSGLAPWAGLRPATPGGLPLIGRGPLDNLYLNTGHGALGWTLACGSAELLAAEIDQTPQPIAAAPFALSL